MHCYTCHGLKTVEKSLIDVPQKSKEKVNLTIPWILQDLVSPSNAHSSFEWGKTHEPKNNRKIAEINVIIVRNVEKDNDF